MNNKNISKAYVAQERPKKTLLKGSNLAHKYYTESWYT